jgi:hypothetical protein
MNISIIPTSNPLLDWQSPAFSLAVITYSLLKLSTGFATAAFIAW